MATYPTGTVTFLFTDIEGSTRRWEQQPELMKAALELHDAILLGAVQANDGAVFQTGDDSFVIAFATASQALAALEAQRGLLAAAWPAEVVPLRVRMALHAGSAEYRADGYHAEHTFNRLARLLRSRLVGRAGRFCWLQGDHGRAQRLQEQNLALSRALDYKPGIAYALNNLAAVLFYRGDYADVRKMQEDSLAVGREIGDRVSMAAALHNLGALATQQTGHAEALPLYQESLAPWRELGDRRNEASVVLNLGVAAYQHGDYALAGELFERRLALGRALGDKKAIATAAGDLGGLALDRGETWKRRGDCSPKRSPSAANSVTSPSRRACYATWARSLAPTVTSPRWQCCSMQLWNSIARRASWSGSGRSTMSALCSPSYAASGLRQSAISARRSQIRANPAITGNWPPRWSRWPGW